MTHINQELFEKLVNKNGVNTLEGQNKILKSLKNDDIRISPRMRIMI